MIKSRKLIFMLFTLACFIAMGTCLIVDIAINQQITWAAYPLLSIPFCWIILSPLLIKRYGKILAPCVLTLAVLPFLYFLAPITPAGDWFLPLGLPSAVAGIISGWMLYVLFLFTKINIWYKSAVSVFLLGVIVSPVISHFADAYAGTEPSFLSYFINIFSCAIVSAILGILGYQKTKAKVGSLNQE
ncbi:MAG: hypothetical protein FWE80_08615 [Oscillospiraceae bacterium]|nr:hypothetical protein [Oscillospiraceae bacterium]